MTKIADTLEAVMATEPDRVWDASDLAVELWKAEEKAGTAPTGGNFIKRVRDALRRAPRRFLCVSKPEFPSKVGFQLTYRHPPTQAVVATPVPAKSERFGISHLLFLTDAYKALVQEEDRIANQILALPEVIGLANKTDLSWKAETDCLLSALGQVQEEAGALKAALEVVASSVVEATARKKLVIAIRAVVTPKSQSLTQITKTILQSGTLPNNLADPKESVRMVLETMVSRGIVKKSRTKVSQITKYRSANGN